MATKITLVKGDITLQHVDAIVNAANSGLRGGGGVDGAIHRAGGPQIAEECRRIAQEKGGCPTGQAVITSAGRLPARYVVHAVGPVWRGGGHGEAKLLASAYRSALELALQHGVKTLAFPSISTGAYGYPIEQAARIALRTIRDFLERHGYPFEEVRCVLFSETDYRVYQDALREIQDSGG
ncbi:MAG: O-acetyl-ADP-ribose deacetylase [Bacillota bacterium]